MAIFLISIGAYPVPIFLGLDVVGVVIAFRIYARRAGRAERVRVDADRITVSREDAKGSRTVWTSSTAFTRIRFETPEGRLPRLSLQVGAQSLPIGLALGADECTRLEARLRRAMADALAERHG